MRRSPHLTIDSRCTTCRVRVEDTRSRPTLRPAPRSQPNNPERFADLRSCLSSLLRFVLPSNRDFWTTVCYVVIVWPVLIYLLCAFVMIPLADTLNLISKLLLVLVRLLRLMFGVNVFGANEFSDMPREATLQFNLTQIGSLGYRVMNETL